MIKGDIMKKKIIILLVGIILLTGCNVVDEITINDDCTVNEKVGITINNSITSNYDSPTGYINSYLNYYKKSIEGSSYRYETEENDNTSTITFSNDSKNICDAINNNLFSQNLYKFIKCTEDDDYYYVQSEGKQKLSLPSSEQTFNVESITIKLKLPVEALESNADIVDGKVYTWNYNKTTPSKKFLYIRISKNSIKENMENVKTRKSILKYSIIIGVFLIIVIVVVKTYKKIKKNNEY